MKITIRYDNEGDDWSDETINLHDEDLTSFLACNGIGHGGSYYKISSKIFEFLDDDRSLTVIAKKDYSVTF